VPATVRLHFFWSGDREPTLGAWPRTELRPSLTLSSFDFAPDARFEWGVASGAGRITQFGQPSALSASAHNGAGAAVESQATINLNH
jgi:hypothetical protein